MDRNKRFSPRGWFKQVGAAATLSVLVGSPALASELTGDAVHGAKLFLQCRACHTVGQTDPSGVGPNLWGVVGSKAGSRFGFRYSAALSSLGIVWTHQTLDQWLTQPTAVAPGTIMAFQGVASPQARADIVAYLDTLGPKPLHKASNEGSCSKKARRCSPVRAKS